MGYGIEIRGKDGGLLLDSDYHLLKFIGKGTNVMTGVAANGGLLGTTYYGQVKSPALSLTSEPTVFCYIASGQNIDVARVWASDATHRTFQYNSTLNMYPTTYWFENKTKVASGDPYGLLVYDSSKKLLFDSGWYKKDLMNVINIKSLYAAAGHSMTVSAGITKPAFMFHSTYARYIAEQYSGHLHRLTLSRSSWNFSLAEMMVQYQRFTYGCPYGSQTWADGHTYPVPVIDGALYD